MSTAFVNDIGTIIQLDAGVDITAASQVDIIYQKPNRLTGTWNASASTQYASYTTESGDLDIAGTWLVQVYVTGLDGWTGHGNIASFKVVAPIST